MHTEPIHEEYRKIVGRNIYLARRSKGMKITTLAKMAEVSYSVISQVENGIYESLKQDLLVSIARCLKLSMQDLYRKTEEE